MQADRPQRLHLLSTSFWRGALLSFTTSCAQPPPDLTRTAHYKKRASSASCIAEPATHEHSGHAFPEMERTLKRTAAMKRSKARNKPKTWGVDQPDAIYFLVRCAKKKSLSRIRAACCPEKFHKRHFAKRGIYRCCSGLVAGVVRGTYTRHVPSFYAPTGVPLFGRSLAPGLPWLRRQRDAKQQASYRVYGKG